MKFLIFFYLLFYSFFVFSKADPRLLSHETSKRFERVPEFEFIIQEAEKLGVKVYLFGGTASAFAHYVRWDLEREAGDVKYQAERFDYDFTNIYRGNQDLDIVVDGTQAQAEQLRKILQQTYPHFMGDREAWEVRLLKATMGDKKPLLDDYDFKNQHTDTNSTGMLTLNPSEDEIVYRDLLDWENPKSEFLTDVAAAKIKFLYNDKHETTSRFKEGKNPPILAAIRYLAKLTQYEVKGVPEDLEIVKKIISQTEANEFTPYVRKKAFEFGLKALLNAPDVEYAWNLLEETGARKLLMNVDGNRTGILESLSWWFNKEPLRSFEIGEDSGKTAAEIFKTNDITVAHETRSFIAYENITRSARGSANVFISRKNTVGEGAVFGDGFYAKVGRVGAVGTGLTIRFKLNPQAREGTDFLISTVSNNIIIVKNKRALRLIQENINMDMLSFFKLFTLGEIDKNDKGMLEKFKRKLNRASYDSKELEGVKEYLLQEIPVVIKGELVLFGRKHFDQFPMLERVLKSIHSFEDLLNFFQKSYLKVIIRDLSRLLKKIKIEPDSLQFVELMESIMLFEDRGLSTILAQDIFSREELSDRPDLFIKLSESCPCFYKEMAEYVLVKEHWALKHTNLVDRLISEDMYAERPMGMANNLHPAALVLSQEFWLKKPEYIQSLIDQDKAIHVIIRSVLSQEMWAKSPYGIKWIKQIMDKNNETWDAFISASVFSKPHWGGHPEIVRELIERELKSAKKESNQMFHSQISYEVLSKPYYSDHPEFVSLMIEKGVFVIELALKGSVLDKPHWGAYPELIEQLSDKADVLIMDDIVELLKLDHWAQYPKLFYRHVRNMDERQKKAVKSDHHFNKVEMEKAWYALNRFAYSDDFAKKYPLVVEFFDGEEINFNSLREKFSTPDFLEFLEQREGKVRTCSSLL